MMHNYPNGYRIHYQSRNRMYVSDHVKVLKLWMNRHPNSNESWIGRILFEILCAESPLNWGAT